MPRRIDYGMGSRSPGCRNGRGTVLKRVPPLFSARGPTGRGRLAPVPMLFFYFYLFICLFLHPSSMPLITGQNGPLLQGGCLILRLAGPLSFKYRGTCCRSTALAAFSAAWYFSHYGASPSGQGSQNLPVHCTHRRMTPGVAVSESTHLSSARRSLSAVSFAWLPGKPFSWLIC